MDKFNPDQATKEQFDAEIERLLQLGIRAEEGGKSEKLVNAALRKAETVENQRNAKFA